MLTTSKIKRNPDLIDRDTQTIKSWSQQNKIEINWKKSGIMLNKKTTKKPEATRFQSFINCNYPEIPIVSEYKYLGVLFDSKFNMTKQIAKDIQYAKMMTVFFRRLPLKNFKNNSLVRIWNALLPSRYAYTGSSNLKLDA